MFEGKISFYERNYYKNMNFEGKEAHTHKKGKFHIMNILAKGKGDIKDFCG